MDDSFNIHAFCQAKHNYQPSLFFYNIKVPAETELIAMRVIQFLLVYILHNLRANVSKGRESPEKTKKSNSILFYQKIPLGG